MLSVDRKVGVASMSRSVGEPQSLSSTELWESGETDGRSEEFFNKTEII